MCYLEIFYMVIKLFLIKMRILDYEKSFLSNKDKWRYIDVY